MKFESSVQSMPGVVGDIEVFCGPMFSGKSHHLVRRLLELESQGEAVLAFRPRKDTRDTEPEIISRTGARFPAIRIQSYAEVAARLTIGTTVVAFDEPNILPEGFIDTCLKLVVQGFKVIVSALNLDFRGRPIPPMSDILCYPTKVTYLTADCACGGEPATRTHRTVDSKETILVGDSESYEPVCIGCFMARNDGKIIL